MKISLITWCCLVAAACSAERRYVGDGTPYQVALTPETPPALASEDGDLYIVETRVALPVRAPTRDELAQLQRDVSGYPGLPFPRLPWLERDDFGLQLDFTLSNLDDQPHDIDIIINGANEFYEYVPRVIETDNEGPIPLHAQWERRYRLQGNSRRAATVREEEFDEMAVDLASVVNGAPNSDELVYFENNASDDPRAAPYIPAVIPGLVALRFGLRTSAAGSVLLEATIRVRDEADKLTQSADTVFQVTPQLFESVVPET